MTNLYVPEEGAHWYYQDGRPCYEVPRADGKGMRVPTIRDARTLHLMPSVSGITRVMHRPGLQAWIINQHLIAAMTLPRLPDEPSDEFTKRVVRDAAEYAKRAADFGTRMHEVIERYLAKQDYMENLLTSDIPFIGPLILWLSGQHITPIHMEASFCNVEEGYGGRLDCVADYEPWGVSLIDWKTQATKKDEPFHHYPEHGIQLAGYGHGVPEYADVPHINVLISSTEPGRIEPYTWLPSETWRWEAFKACRTIWYSPAGPGGTLTDPENRVWEESSDE